MTHDFQSVTDFFIGTQEDGIDNNAVFGAFHFINFQSLLFYGHILMDDTDTALTSHGDGHSMFSYGIHTGAHQRDI